MRLSLFIVFYFYCLTAFCQPKYWIVFKDKNPENKIAISDKTFENRKNQGLVLIDETDLSINKNYIESINGLGLKIINQSRWLNAISTHLTDIELDKIKKQPFVKEIILIDRQLFISSVVPVKKQMLAPVMAQVQAEVFKNAGLTGKGVTIGVIDAGFYEAPLNGSLKPLFERSAILDTRDYVNPQHLQKFYTDAESFSDFHGTEVLTAIAGQNLKESTQEGLATDAQFYLARTDHGMKEWRGEEDNWVAAMEWLDSLGVRVINTSLGYASGFTDPNENYKPSEMDGKTSMISRAAQMAVDKKGILLVVSAGNEGDDANWRLISTPADAEGVLAVGATNQRLWSKAGYSSIGPEFLNYLKPNVSCFSLFGTSLSAPVITGFAACLMQANPKLSNRELKNIIEQSAHLYPYGNNYVGYGVPLASKALQLVNGKVLLPNAPTIRGIGEASLVVDTETVVVYHKKNQWQVISQEVVKTKDNQLVVTRPTGVSHTTVDTKKAVFEIIWE